MCTSLTYNSVIALKNKKKQCHCVKRQVPAVWNCQCGKVIHLHRLHSEGSTRQDGLVQLDQAQLAITRTITIHIGLTINTTTT